MSHAYTACPDGLSPCLLSRGAGSPRTALNSGKPAALGHRPAVVSACASHVSTVTDTAQTQGHPDPTHSPASAFVLNLIFKEPALFPEVGKARAPRFLGTPHPTLQKRPGGTGGPRPSPAPGGGRRPRPGSEGCMGSAWVWAPVPTGASPEARGAKQTTEGLVKWEPSRQPSSLGDRLDPETRKRGKWPTQNQGSG